MNNLNEKELRRQVFLKLKKELYDEFGVYNHPLEPNMLNSSDFYDLFENYEEIREIIDEEYKKLRPHPTAIIDYDVIRIEEHLLKIKDEMIENNEYERKIRRKQYYRRGVSNNIIIQAFDILSKKYNLFEAREGLYYYILPLDEINNEDKLMNTQWFFKEDNTQFSEFLVKSEKIFVDEELFIIPIVRKISRGKKKGVYSHYILIDNSLKEIYLYTVSDFRYLERRSSLYKLLNNLFSKGRAQLFIKYLIDNAPKMAHNNNIIMKSIFKGKTGNFYRNQILIKR